MRRPTTSPTATRAWTAIGRPRRPAAKATGAWRRWQGRRQQEGKRTNIVSLHGWEWEANEEFIIERLIGKMVADGGEVPGHEGKKIPAGTILYKVLWEGFPLEIATWEEEDSIPCGEVDFVAQYEDGLDAEEQEAAEATLRSRGGRNRRGGLVRAVSQV